ncbi:MAG: hypothetical protein E6K60_05620 [Nitrospirae bacterium]|nr:MAG: hypothetical protein E6K60_05620 [Nitrospirota bacterium]
MNGSYAALKTLPALFALLVVLTGALAQTSPREELPGLGPDGFVSVQSLALGDGQTIYAGSFGGGIFKSDDGGRSWQVANEGLSDLFVYVVMVAPDQTLYAGTLKGGVFRSRNSGKSWMAANAGLDRLETHVLMHHQGTLYAGTGSGVFRSKDQGDTWQSENEGLSNLLIRALVVDAKGMMYAGTTGMGIYRKPQGTSKWLRITQSQLSHPRDRLPENFVRALVVNESGELFAGTADNGVYVSGDRGETWRMAGRGVENASIRALAIRGPSWFVGTGQGMYRSVDRGKNWTPINHGLTETSIQTFVVGKEGTVYAGTSAGIFKTEDDGAHWMPVNQGMGTSRKPLGPVH